MSFAEDISLFFPADGGFAETVSWTPAGGSASTFSAIFDREYADVLEIASTSPVIRFATEDASTMKRGDAVTVRSTSFKVANVEADGTGVTLARLEVQA